MCAETFCRRPMERQTKRPAQGARRLVAESRPATRGRDVRTTDPGRARNDRKAEEGEPACAPASGQSHEAPPGSVCRSGQHSRSGPWCWAASGRGEQVRGQPPRGGIALGSWWVGVHGGARRGVCRVLPAGTRGRCPPAGPEPLPTGDDRAALSLHRRSGGAPVLPDRPYRRLRRSGS